MKRMRNEKQRKRRIQRKNWPMFFLTSFIVFGLVFSLDWYLIEGCQVVVRGDEEGLVHPRVVQVVAHRRDEGRERLQGRQLGQNLGRRGKGCCQVRR